MPPEMPRDWRAIWAEANERGDARMNDEWRERGREGASAEWSVARAHRSNANRA